MNFLKNELVVNSHLAALHVRPSTVFELMKLKFESDSHRMLMHLFSRLETRSQLSLSSWTWSRPTHLEYYREYCEKKKIEEKFRRRQPASSKLKSRTVDFAVTEIFGGWKNIKKKFTLWFNFWKFRLISSQEEALLNSTQLRERICSSAELNFHTVLHMLRLLWIAN